MKKVFLLLLVLLCERYSHAQTKQAIISSIDAKVTSNPTTPLRGSDLNVILKNILNFPVDTVWIANDSLRYKVAGVTRAFEIPAPQWNKITGKPTFTLQDILANGSALTGSHTVTGATGSFAFTGFNTFDINASATNLFGAVKFNSLTGPDTRMVTIDADGNVGAAAIPVGGDGGITTETDPTVSNAVKGITSTNISNWTTAHGWGNHSGLYKLVGWVPAWPDVTEKPTFATVAFSGDYNDLINKPTGGGGVTNPLTLGSTILRDDGFGFHIVGFDGQFARPINIGRDTSAVIINGSAFNAQSGAVELGRIGTGAVTLRPLQDANLPNDSRRRLTVDKFGRIYTDTSSVSGNSSFDLWTYPNTGLLGSGKDSANGLRLDTISVVATKSDLENVPTFNLSTAQFKKVGDTISLVNNIVVGTDGLYYDLNGWRFRIAPTDSTPITVSAGLVDVTYTTAINDFVEFTNNKWLSANGYNNAQGLVATPIASSTDVSYQADYEGEANRSAPIGFRTTGALSNAYYFDYWEYSVLVNDEGKYRVWAQTANETNTPTVDAQAGDKYRIRRTGATIIAEYWRGGQWYTIHTFSQATTAPLYLVGCAQYSNGIKELLNPKYQ